MSFSAAAAKAAAAREAAAAQAAAARLAAEVAEPIDESYHVVFSSRRGVLFLCGGVFDRRIAAMA